MSRILPMLALVLLLAGCSSEPPPSLDPIRSALPDARSVLVLGDSTGNDAGEWVELWANDLTSERTVTYHYWNPDLESFPPQVELGGSGPALDIWNLAKGGVRADYPRPFLDLVTQEPDVVLYSFGHNHTEDDIGPALLGTMDVVEKRWGDVLTAWVLQNPSSSALRERQADTMAKLRDLSVDEGVPTVDVYDVFPKDVEAMGRLLLDGTHPNDEASRIWADEVARLLGFPEK